MNTPTLLLLSAGVGGVAGGAAALLATPGNAPAPPTAEAAGPLADPDLERRLGVLEQAVEEQRMELSDLDDQLDARLSQLSRRPVAEVVPEPSDAAPAAAEAVPEVELEETLTAAGLFEQLLAADGMLSEELWQLARERGLTDELLALYEARAEGDPNDPDLQHELGVAYIQKLQEAGQSAMAGMWASKADSAFDRALEVDADHWDARMYKAVSLSYWPPIFGKQKEAVSQFEILIERQASLPPEPGHAEPYLLLGNLHWQRGDSEAALAVWQQGHDKFPDSTSLAEKLSGSD